MNKLDMLFIRACKDRNAKKRIKSIYRRYYYRGTQSVESYNNAIISILGNIAERYIGGMSVTSAFQDVIKEMSFEKFYAWVNKDYPVQCMEEHMINFFIERIRFTEKAKFPAEMNWGK